MCGLVGLVVQSKNGPWKDEYDAFNQMMVVNNIRGAHSTGVGAVFNDKSVGYRKSLGSVWDLWNCTNWAEFSKEVFGKARFVMGHGRSATRGEINVDNAHPFIVDEANDRRLLLVHNGTLTQHQKLPDFSKYPVDSLWMCHMIAQKGVREVFEQINGAIATMWYDTETNTVNFYRNYERPLFRAKLPNGSYLFNSELESLVWINTRLKLRIKPEDVTDLTPYVLYSLNLENLEWKEEKIEKKYESSTTYWNNARAYWMGGGWTDDVDPEDPLGVKAERIANTTISNVQAIRSRTNTLLRVIDDEYNDLRTNMRLRQIYLDVFSGKASQAVFDSRGAVVTYTDSKLPVTSQFPHIMAPKFAVTRIIHNREGELDEESILAGQGTFVKRVKWADIFEPVVPITRRAPQESSKEDEEKEARRPLIGRKFRPSKKIRFSVTAKTGGKNPKEIQIKNFGLTTSDNKYCFDIYGNEVDGSFYVGGTVAFEPFEATEISTFNNQGKPPIYKVLANLLDHKSHTLTTIEWYTGEYHSKDEIFAGGVFLGNIERIALASKMENKHYGDAVRIFVNHVECLDKVSTEMSKRHAADNQYTYDMLLKRAEISQEEIIEGNEE